MRELTIRTYQLDDGHFVVADQAGWVDGAYADEAAAVLGAFVANCDTAALARLWESRTGDLLTSAQLLSVLEAPAAKAAEPTAAPTGDLSLPRLMAQIAQEEARLEKWRTLAQSDPSELGRKIALANAEDAHCKLLCLRVAAWLAVPRSVVTVGSSFAGPPRYVAYTGMYQPAGTGHTSLEAVLDAVGGTSA